MWPPAVHPRKFAHDEDPPGPNNLLETCLSFIISLQTKMEWTQFQIQMNNSKSKMHVYHDPSVLENHQLCRFIGWYRQCARLPKQNEPSNFQEIFEHLTTSKFWALELYSKKYVLNHVLLFSKKNKTHGKLVSCTFLNCLKLSCISLLFWSMHLDRSVASQAQEIEGSHPTSQLRWGGKLMKNIGGCFCSGNPQTFGEAKWHQSI